MTDDYRRMLTRRWDWTTPQWTVIGLNPSTAEADPAGKDDPTSRKIIYLTKRDGAGSFWLVNLFPRRAVKPADLFRLSLAERLGPWADQTILACAKRTAFQGGKIVVAWGAHPKAAFRAEEVRRLLEADGHTLWCWGQNTDGSPKHPLYLPNTTPLVPFA